MGANSKEECSSCRFWKRHVGDDGWDYDNGECRRRTPTASKGETEFPYTDEGDWCGEYSLRRSDALDRKATE